MHERTAGKQVAAPLFRSPSVRPHRPRRNLFA